MKLLLLVSLMAVCGCSKGQYPTPVTVTDVADSAYTSTHYSSGSVLTDSKGNELIAESPCIDGWMKISINHTTNFRIQCREAYEYRP